MKTTIKADSVCYNHPGDKEISPELRTKTAEGADEVWGFVEQSKEEKTTIKRGRLWEAERYIPRLDLEIIKFTRRK